MNTGGSSVKRKLPFDSCGSPVPLSHKRPKGDRTISQQSVTSDSEENYHALDNSEMSIQENGETISPKMNDISIDDLLETFAGMTLPEREYEDCPVCGVRLKSSVFADHVYGCVDHLEQCDVDGQITRDERIAMSLVHSQVDPTARWVSAPGENVHQLRQARLRGSVDSKEDKGSSALSSDEVDQYACTYSISCPVSIQQSMETRIDNKG
eukprot:884481_1